MKIGVLGLGEAGSLIAEDLIRAGDEVHVHDPAPVPTPQGVQRHDRAADAVGACLLVLAVTPGHQAREALEEVLPALESGALYADLSTGSPGAKAEMADLLDRTGCLFADVALMSPVPGRGVSAPALASGNGAGRYAELINQRGGNVEIVGPRAGEAARRKLLRSVVMKGLAALLIESMEAGRRAGEDEWLWEHLVDQLTSLDRAMIDRLLLDTPVHAVRRLDEMKSARDMLVESGVPADMTSATIAYLARLAGEPVPDPTETEPG